MGVWTLTHNADTRTLAEWGLQQCVITEQSLTAGMFSATVPGDMLASLPWEFQDQVTLALDGVTQLVGVALSPRRVGSGSSEQMMLRFADPWWWLGQGTYMQQWWVEGGGGGYDSPRTALFASVSLGGWIKQSIAASVAHIVLQCNSYFGGNVMQLGDLRGDGFNEKPIPQRVANATYESAMREVLAWVPDAVQQWDYSTTPPTLHLVQRQAATARSFPFADVLTQQQLMKRDDMVVRGIQITYAGLNGGGHVSSVIDQAGETTGTRLLKTVVDCTGNSSGSVAPPPSGRPAITREYEVVSESIDMTADWWFKYGDTGAVSAADIVVGNESSVEFAPNAPENEGKDDLGGCGLQWLSGGIPKTRISANTRVALVTGYLTVRTVKAGDSGEVITSTETQERRIVKMLVPVTKLSGSYTQVIAEASSGIVDTIPKMISNTYITTGLAAALLAVWSVPQYDGEINLVRDECDVAAEPGDVVNLTGALSEWETMDTQIQGRTRMIDAGTTTLQLGVAAHLGLDEYAGQLRMSRARPVTPAADLDQQATGQVPGAADSDPEEQDDMIGPGGIKYSVLYGPQKIKTTTATAIHLTDMTADAGPTVSNKNTDSGDEVVTTPGQQTVQNPGQGKTNTSTPGAIELRTGEDKSIKISVEGGIEMEDGDNTIKLSIAGGLVISDGTKTTTLSLLELLHSNGDGRTNSVTDEQMLLTNEGKTNSVTNEQMVIAGSGKTGIYESGLISLLQSGGSVGLSISSGLEISNDGSTLSATPFEIQMASGTGESASLSPTAGLSLDDEGNSVRLDVEHLAITVGDDTATLTPASLRLLAESYEATLSVGDGVHLVGVSGGTVDIKPIAEKEISLQETGSCEDEDGVSTPKKAHYLRSESEAI